MNPKENHISSDYTIFQLGQVYFGIPVADVREVLLRAAITCLPSAPPWMLGVTKLRGHNIAVMDLAIKLNIKGSTDASWGHMIVVRVKPFIFAILVDKVTDVMAINHNDIDQRQRIAGKYLKDEIICGISNIGEKSVMLLNTEKIFQWEEKEVLKEFAA